jgi:drug/metabolite transporter (DMT)-like permease
MCGATIAARRLQFGMSSVSASELLSEEGEPSTPQSARWVTDLLLFVMAVIWGINFSVIKYGTIFIAPLAYNGIRIPIAAAAQLAIARGMRLKSPAPKARMRLILLGMLGNGVYQILFILGVVRTSVATAALIVAATPALIAILGRLRGTELLTRRNWSGIACQLLGASTVVLGTSTGNRGEDTMLGGALMLAAAISWALYSVSLREISKGMHTMQIGAYTALGGAIVMLVVGAPALLATKWMTVPPAAWGAVLYSSLLAMTVAYLFWYRGLRVLGPTRTAVYSNLQPLIAAIVAYFALGEVPTVTQGIGGILVVTGLLLTRA